MHCTATCSCSQLTAIVSGEPIRVAMCHCLARQWRTGSVFSVQARFKADDVTKSGVSNGYARVAKSGNRLSFHFCLNCAATQLPDSQFGVDYGRLGHGQAGASILGLAQQNS
jgi:hypothetical protein